MRLRTTASPPLRPVFSGWAWLLFIPYGLATFGEYDHARSTSDQLIGITAAAAAHLVVGVMFVGATLVERRIRTGWLHLGWSAVALAAISFVRPAVVSWVQGALGVDLLGTQWGYLQRVAATFVIFGLFIVLVHWFLENGTRNVDVRARLNRVAAEMAATREQSERTDARFRAEFDREVAQPLRSALEALRTLANDPEELAEALRTVAHEVVRPLSHRTFQMDAEAVEYVWSGAPVLAPAPRRLRLLAPTRITISPAWMPMLLWLLLVISPSIDGLGAVGGVVWDVASGAVVLVAGFFVGLIPLPRRANLAILVLTLEYLAIGALAAWVIAGRLPADQLLHDLEWAIEFAALAVILAVSRSSRQEFLDSELELVDRVAEAARADTDARIRLATTTQTLARLLHTHVQGDIIATSLRLKMGTNGTEAVDGLLRRIDRSLAGADVDENGLTPETVRSLIDSTIASWSTVLRIDDFIDETVLPWMAEHPAAAEVLRDAFAEGLTNAIRHDRATATSATLQSTGAGAELTIRTPGRLRSASDDGIGLADLRERATELSLTQEDELVVLRVVVGEPREATRPTWTAPRPS